MSRSHREITTRFTSRGLVSLVLYSLFPSSQHLLFPANLLLCPWQSSSTVTPSRSRSAVLAFAVYLRPSVYFGLCSFRLSGAHLSTALSPRSLLCSSLNTHCFCGNVNAKCERMQMTPHRTLLNKALFMWQMSRRLSWVVVYQTFGKFKASASLVAHISDG